MTVGSSSCGRIGFVNPSRTKGTMLWPPKLKAKLSHQSDTTFCTVMFGVLEIDAIRPGSIPSITSTSPFLSAWIIASALV